MKRWRGRENSLSRWLLVFSPRAWFTSRFKPLFVHKEGYARCFVIRRRALKMKYCYQERHEPVRMIRGRKSVRHNCFPRTYIYISSCVCKSVCASHFPVFHFSRYKKGRNQALIKTRRYRWPSFEVSLPPPLLQFHFSQFAFSYRRAEGNAPLKSFLVTGEGSGEEL